MSGAEAAKVLTAVGNDVMTSIDKIMLKLGEDANAMIAKRIQETGINAEGIPLPPYSTKPMLVNCSNPYMTKEACTKILGNKTEKKAKGKRSQYEKYLAAESGEFDTKWVTLKKGGKKIKLFELPEGYKQFREINNRRTDIVDLMWSGGLWSNIKVLRAAKEGSMGVARISPESKEYALRLAGITDRKGIILDLNKKEVKLLLVEANKWLTDIIKKNGL